MKNWWRRARGALSMGLTWAVGWAPIGAAVAGVSTLLGAGSAAASLAIARQAKDRELLEDGTDGAGLGRAEKEAQYLPE